MTLRLRLTLFNTGVILIVLMLAGFGLHVLLARSLLQGIDENLGEAAELIGALLPLDSDDTLNFDDDRLSAFSRDNVLLVYNDAGETQLTLGQVPSGFTEAPVGYSNWDNWRVFAVQNDTGAQTVVVMLSTDDLHETLTRFDTVFFWTAPLVTLLAFLISYALAGTALAPVAHLTRAAFDLSMRGAWRETLPEPQQRDELWQLSRATNTLLSSLARLIESERHFTDDAAHELRTPLTVLHGRLERALEQSSEAPVQLSLKKALKAAKDLLALVEKLLLLARTEAGQGLSKVPLDLREVAQESAALVSPLFRDKGLELNLVLPGDAVPVWGDAAALELLLRNLLDNALKFTAQGQVRLTLWAEDTKVYLQVLDEGPGVPPEALAHVFKRFYQASPSQRRSGSGLGLALVKSVADWHGGTLSATNTDTGACFTLELPRYTAG